MIGNFYLCKPPLKTWERDPQWIRVRVVSRWKGQHAKRNVLVECQCCGHRWTRPFRGMKRIEPEES